VATRTCVAASATPDAHISHATKVCLVTAALPVSARDLGLIPVVIEATFE
jgi:hypothetical protein